MGSVYTDEQGMEHTAKLVNVMMPMELIEAIDQARGRLARADWIRDACVDKLPKKMRPEIAMRRPGNPNGIAVAR